MPTSTGHVRLSGKTGSDGRVVKTARLTQVGHWCPAGHRPTILLYRHSISPSRGGILSSEHVERRLAAILAAGVAGSCRLIGIDEDGALAQLKALRKTLFDPKITDHRVRVVKDALDGALVEFDRVVDSDRVA